MALGVRGALVCGLLMIATACHTTTVPAHLGLYARSVDTHDCPSDPIGHADAIAVGIPCGVSVRGFWVTIDEIASATSAPPALDKLAV